MPCRPSPTSFTPLAPPISSHERLLIHITHDMVGYPSLDPLIHGVFSRVMAQVEGGDLLVVQRGQENTLRSPTAGGEKHLFGTASASGSGGSSGGGGIGARAVVVAGRLA